MEKISRREWAGAMMAGTLATSVKPGSSCVVVGAGVFGAWTAHRLQEAGLSVTLLDQYGPSSSRASSGGETRIIRCSYGPDEIYTRMAKRSLTLWSDLFKRLNVNLFRRIGVLWIAKPNNEYVQQSREILRKVGVKFEDLSNADLQRKYPQIRAEPEAIAIFEPDSGALMAREAVRAVVNNFVSNGGSYRQAAAAAPKGSGRLMGIHAQGTFIRADTFVFACGAWLGKVFPNVLGQRIFPTRQEVLFFGVPPGDTRFSPPAMPVWIDFGDGLGMYGFPDLDTRGFKVAFDLHGPPIDPDTEDRLVRPSKIAEAREYVRQRFPELAHSPVVDSRVCQYENTSNGDFVIDRHPEFDNVWLVGGGSGHGFKHGPAVGEYVSARITGAATPPVEPRFLLASKKTEQKRAVY